MKRDAAQLVTAAATASFGKRLPETTEAVTGSPVVEGVDCVCGNRSNRSNRFYTQMYRYMCVACVRKDYVHSLPTIMHSHIHLFLIFKMRLLRLLRLPRTLWEA